LKSCAKIHTTVIWETYKCKSWPCACNRSKVGRPICLCLSLMRSTVIQIFM